MHKTFILAVLILISGCIGSSEEPSDTSTGMPIVNETNANETAVQEHAGESDEVRWEYADDEWNVYGNPPECPSLELETPVDVSLATSVLYPGQYRGADYKPHGGFRFDDQTANDIEVRAPFDGYVIRAGRYDFGDGVQITFDIFHPCGIMYRLGHLAELSSKFQKLADELSEPGMDSRLYAVTRTKVTTGELIATKVGLEDNVFVDWGVYDLRTENEASRDPAYKEEFSNWRELAFNAICWLDYLPEEDESIVKSLPGADNESGKQSDYC